MAIFLAAAPVQMVQAGDLEDAQADFDEAVMEAKDEFHDALTDAQEDFEEAVAEGDVDAQADFDEAVMDAE